MKAFLRLLVLTLFGCAYTKAPMHWPTRGAFVCVTNPTAERLALVARDGSGRALVLARMEPDGTYVGRWPFIHLQGQLLAGPYNTRVFYPWDASGWSWAIGDSLEAGGCP